jgi:hypothetical protein
MDDDTPPPTWEARAKIVSSYWGMPLLGLGLAALLFAAVIIFGHSA